ncbi:MAG: ABC transporter permease subunit [Kiritimatiellae bacterium]|nr:ABC transporter permease subunit [Kiritimatiellia bacterium]
MERFRNTWTVVKRELASYFNSPVAYVFMIVFLLLNGFFTFLVDRFYERGEADLRWFFRWHPWLYLVLAPAATMRLWAEEKRAGTIELLLTMPVTSIQAIAGKFLAAWLFMGMALLLTLPIVGTTYYLGAPDGGVIIGSYMGSFLMAGAYLAVGMLTSAMTRNQVIGFIVAVVISMLMLFAGWPMITEPLSKLAPLIMKVVAGFSFMPHYESIQRGVLDIRDFVYFASVITFMLFGTHLILENRKSL